MILHAVIALSIFVGGEYFFNLVLFKNLKSRFIKSPETGRSVHRLLFLPIPVVKGALERLVLFVGLHYEFSQVLIVFGALKMGTRFTDEQAKDISNDYFLVGNFASILIAITYTVSYRFIVS